MVRLEEVGGNTKMGDISLTEIIDYSERKKREEKKKRILRTALGIALIPATVVAFYYLPSIIADTISYYQSKKYGEKKQEDDLDGDE